VATPTFTQAAHVALTVREGPSEARHPRQLVRHPDSGLVLGIHEPYERSNDRFDPQRTGLDHLAVTVTDRAALNAWIAHLDAQGVEHSPVRDAGYAEFVSFADPDGIAWELWLPTA
jgi:glyoxylase I family protein